MPLLNDVLRTALVLCMLATKVSAHHSFASFDMDDTRSIAGTVKRFEWTNPHTWIVLEVQTDSGQQQEWRFEGPPPINMLHGGWAENTLQTGDHISLSYHPRKDSQREGSFTAITLPNGKQIGALGPVPQTP